MDAERQPLWKPPRGCRRREKRRRETLEQQVKRLVRAGTADRDGYCRLKGTPVAKAVPCRGRSEWAHASGHRRSQTVNQPAEVRHSMAGSFMGCTAHHQLHESNRLRELPLTDAGMNGDVAWVLWDHRQERVLVRFEEGK